MLFRSSQTFEQAFFSLLQQGLITQDEAMANCDSPTNLIWLINNTEAGGALKAAQAKIAQGDGKATDAPPPPPPAAAAPTSFADFKLDVPA